MCKHTHVISFSVKPGVIILTFIFQEFPGSHLSKEAQFIKTSITTFIAWQVMSCLRRSREKRNVWIFPKSNSIDMLSDHKDQRMLCFNSDIHLNHVHT